MSDEITSHSYWAEVRSLAESIASEGASDGLSREELNERLWETIDSHQWVIYTAYNFDILRFSPNNGYSMENFGAETAIDEGGNLNTAALAFGALYADVLDDLQGCVEECDCCGEPLCEDCGGREWYPARTEAA